MTNSCVNCLRCLLAIPDQFHWILLVRGKGFHISKLPRSTHIMFSWDYYLEDLCSVITLHVTVQRCSPNINSPILTPHARFWKNREIEFLGHRISSSQSVFSFALFTEFFCLNYWPKWPLFSCELSCNWVL